MSLKETSTRHFRQQYFFTKGDVAQITSFPKSNKGQMEKLSILSVLLGIFLLQRSYNGLQYLCKIEQSAIEKYGNQKSLCSLC